MSLVFLLGVGCFSRSGGGRFSSRPSWFAWGFPRQEPESHSCHIRSVLKRRPREVFFFETPSRRLGSCVVSEKIRFELATAGLETALSKAVRRLADAEAPAPAPSQGKMRRLKSTIDLTCDWCRPWTFWTHLFGLSSVDGVKRSLDLTP